MNSNGNAIRAKKKKERERKSDFRLITMTQKQPERVDKLRRRAVKIYLSKRAVFLKKIIIMPYIKAELC